MLPFFLLYRKARLIQYISCTAKAIVKENENDAAYTAKGSGGEDKRAF